MMFDDIAIGDALPTFSRETHFSNWNRYAAVNDEFIDVHMSKEAAQAAGQADVFGMGNLRVAYAHAMLHDWLGNRGDIAQFACQFRQLNFLGDVLDVHASVTGKARVDGHMLVDVALGVTNQNGEETMPGSAQLVLFGDHAAMPAPPPRPEIATREPGVHLDADTISWLGRPLEPLSSYPIDANDIRRWALTAYYPEPAPRELTEIADATAGPWHELVALRDFNPFAWNQAFRPDIYPWMRGMGTEPGRRGLNGGQKSWYFAPMRVGDVITNNVALIDAFEKEGRMGTMLFLVDESRWTNQRDELVRIGQRTSIYY
jgi:acyl dehydratase